MQSGLEEIIPHLKFQVATKRPIRYRPHQEWSKKVAKTYAIYDGDRPFELQTVIAGMVESHKTVKPGDVILTGPDLEQYPMTMLKFLATYNVNKQIVVPQPLPKRVAKVDSGIFKTLALGTFIEFDSPWSEGKMRLEPNDWLAEAEKGRFYRIERKAFQKTYQVRATRKSCTKI